MTDRIHPFTRAVGVVVIPFLAAAFVILVPFADDTDTLFAWTILPPVTAMLLGSAYVGGIWFFIQVVRPNRWHAVRHGFPAVLLFATLLAVATFLHWDKFHFGHLSFIVWVTLYITTPFLVLAAMIVNRGEDPGTPEPNDIELPGWIRLVLALVGIASLIVGLVLFAVPQLAIETWGWTLTPLTARVCGAILTLPGMVNVWMLRERRWSAFRQVFQAQLISLVFILVALWVRWGELTWGRPSAALFVGGMVASFGVYAAVYVWAEVRRSRAAAGDVQ